MTMPTGTPGQPDPAATDDTLNPDGTPKDPEVQETAEDKATRLEAENAALQANSRKWEDRAKANKKKADDFDKLQASSATDAEKLAAAVSRAEEASTKLARYEVAARTGLPADLAEMLTGTDEDAMEDQAKRLIARLAPTEPPKRVSPKPDHSQGGSDKETKLSDADAGKAEAQRRIAARAKKS